ncbi:NAD(P)H-binding protein [Brachybacterium sp. J144]|uniref:NAD(P)H-binding protein n=1 Tax=Brachybacterium sp. J144 TaxID=3116487 RepID=UPI003FA59D45
MARLDLLTRRLVFPLLLPGARADHTAQERLVVGSGLDWTILRPGYLGDGPADPAVVAVRSEDPRRLGLRLSRRDAAGWALRVLEDPGTVGGTYVLGPAL